MRERERGGGKYVVRRDDPAQTRLDPAKEITTLSHPLFALPREPRNNVFGAATRGYGAVNVALNLVEGAEGELRFRLGTSPDGL